jgi:hypothetical protein
MNNPYSRWVATAIVRHDTEGAASTRALTTPRFHWHGELTTRGPSMRRIGYLRRGFRGRVWFGTSRSRTPIAATTMAPAS